jgi:hypothetical protein
VNFPYYNPFIQKLPSKENDKVNIKNSVMTLAGKQFPMRMGKYPMLFIP